MECHQVMPKFVPTFTSRVRVYEINLDEPLDFSDAGWENVTHLSINPGMSVFHNRTAENTGRLHSYEFIRLRNLQYLQIACTCLRYMEENTFFGLEKLTVLDLSNNIDLSIEMVVRGLSGAPSFPNLSELYLSNISVVSFKPFYMGRDFLNIVRQRPLKVLDLSETDTATFAPDELRTAFPHLEVLNLSRAGIAAMAVNAILTYLDDQDVTSFRQLKIMDFSYPTVSSKITDLIFGSLLYGDVTFYFPRNLEEIYMTKFFTTPVRIRGSANSTHFCVLHILKSKPIHFCGVGQLRNLKKAVLADNLVRYVDVNLMHAVRTLEFLDISKNQLGQAMRQKGYCRSILDVLCNLEVLLASENNISVILEDDFRSSKRLRVLDLSKNRLEAITFQTSYLTSLQKLDLRYNKIVFLDAISRTRLTNIMFKPVLNGTVNVTQMILHLKDNPFKCSCENVPFLIWLEQLNETYTCLLDSSEVFIDFFSIKKAEYMCKENIVIIVFSISGFVLVLVVGIIAFALIQEFRRVGRRKGVQKGIEIYGVTEKDENYRPVFLSFCSEDEEVVMEEIYPKLNEGLNKILDTESRCVAIGGIDFKPGFPLANEIIRCIEGSSVVVFFVTNAFCRKAWCRNEALVAHSDNKPTVLMLWEKVDVKLMPKHLYKHYLLYTRVHWVQEQGQRIMKPDWNELCEAIVRLIGENPQETII